MLADTELGTDIRDRREDRGAGTSVGNTELETDIRDRREDRGAGSSVGNTVLILAESTDGPDVLKAEEASDDWIDVLLAEDCSEVGKLSIGVVARVGSDRVITFVDTEDNMAPAEADAVKDTSGIAKLVELSGLKTVAEADLRILLPFPVNEMHEAKRAEQSAWLALSCI